MSSRSRDRRRPAVVPSVLIGLLVLVGVCTVWVGVRGALAATHLAEVRDAAAQFVADPESAGPLVTQLQDDARAAHELTGDPVWAAAETFPWIGPQLAAVGALAEAADIVAAQTLPVFAPLLTGSGSVAFTPRDGALPLDEIASLADETAAPAAAAAEARDLLSRVPMKPLLAPLRAPFEQAREQLGAVADGAQALDNAVRLLPSMLGGEGPRDYLLVFQNNAELRSLGGMPGSLARIRADAGALSLTGQYTAADFAVTEPAGEVPAEIAALYRNTNRAISATTQIPDFSVAAELILDYWKTTRNDEGDLDGVIAIDPVALSYVLGATGPVTLSNGETLTSDNAVDTLLNDVYLRFDAEEQNAYFAEATASVFSAVAEGRYEAGALIAALARAGNERRLLVYSTEASEQNVLQTTTLAGALPPDDDFGVYLNDGTGSKMDYYLHADADVSSAGNTSTLSLTLRSDAPDDAATLPVSITGGGNYGVKPGVTRTVVYLYLPRGASLQPAQRGTFAEFARGLHDRREVLITSVDLAPGESTELTVPVILGGDTEPEIVMTPQVH